MPGRLSAALVLALLLGAPASAQEGGGLSQGFDDSGEPLSDAPAFPGDDGIPPEFTGEVALLDGTGAMLRGLDTINSTVTDFTLRVGETVSFERLEVTLRACLYPEGNAEGEAYAFLEIRDLRESEARFTGWMLASSPALSALDHPRYDVWVLRCSTD